MLHAIVTSSFQYPNGDFGIHLTSQWGSSSDAHDPSHGIEATHREAATRFAVEHGWLGGSEPAQHHSHLVGGGMPGSDVAFCWVIVENPPQWPHWLPEAVLSMEHDHNPAIRYCGDQLRKRMEGSES